MKRDDILKILKEKNISVEKFDRFMDGKTVGYQGGVIDYYDYDVNKFLFLAKCAKIIENRRKEYDDNNKE